MKALEEDMGSETAGYGSLSNVDEGGTEEKQEESPGETQQYQIEQDADGMVSGDGTFRPQVEGDDGVNPEASREADGMEEDSNE